MFRRLKAAAAGLLLSLHPGAMLASKPHTPLAAPAGEHELRETLSVDVFYPDHAPRKESNLFARTKHRLIEVLDTPCWVCGSKAAREVHHMIIEWAFADAIDWSKVKADYPDFDWATFKEPGDFVDSAYNMRVLCATHHRGADRGIHAIPYPIWLAQRYVKAGFVLFPSTPIALGDSLGVATG